MSRDPLAALAMADLFEPEPPIVSFRDRHWFLSNFFPAPVTLDGVRYPTVEHAYQAAKTLDPQERDMVRQARRAGLAKQLGPTLTLRPEWNETFKVMIMKGLLAKKFMDPVLCAQLCATAPRRLVEGNLHGDQFWGVTPDGKGRNMLGHLLMTLRAALLEPTA